MDAIGNKRLAFENPQRLFRPENPIAQPVGNIHGPVRIQTNDMSFREIEIRIMSGHNRIVKDCVCQLGPTRDSARNHRVGIQRTRSGCGSERDSLGAIAREVTSVRSNRRRVLAAC